MAPLGVFLACSEVRWVRNGMATSASRFPSGGHFCDRLFTKSGDTECVYDREPERTQLGS